MLLHRLINLKICMIFIFQISYWHPCILSCSCLSHCVVQLLNHFWLFVTPWTAACQVSLSITISQSLLKLMSIDSQMRSPTISPSVVPLSSCLLSFPASGAFPMSQFFTSCGQSIGASASVLPMSIQGWFPLGLTGLSSAVSKEKHGFPVFT